MTKGIIRFFLRIILNIIHRKSNRCKELPASKTTVYEYTRRISLITSQLDYYYRSPRKKIFMVSSAADIFRFMIRLCEIETIKYKNTGGYAKCYIMLPKRVGEMVLIANKMPTNKRKIAVLKLKINKLEPQIDEIIFKAKTTLN